MHPEAKVFDPNQLPPGPAWLRQLMGDDYFYNVVEVWLLKTNAHIQKADLDELGKLPHVRSVVRAATAGGSATKTSQSWASFHSWKNFNSWTLQR